MPDEFVLVWFESVQRWYALADCGDVLCSGHSPNDALGQALRGLGAAEADYLPAEDRGSFYRFVREPERLPKDSDVLQAQP